MQQQAIVARHMIFPICVLLVYLDFNFLLSRLGTSLRTRDSSRNSQRKVSQFEATVRDHSNRKKKEITRLLRILVVEEEGTCLELHCRKNLSSKESKAKRGCLREELQGEITLLSSRNQIYMQ